MFIKDLNINFKYSKNDIVKNWLRNYPKSKRLKIKNILSIDNDSPTLDKEISKYFNNCENYYIIQTNYDCYKNSIDKLFGSFNFKISYNDILDYELDPYISFDLIIFFTNFNFDKNITSFIKKTFELISNDGIILIITCKHNKFVIETRNFFNLNLLSDSEFKENLKIDCKIFNTYIPIYLDICNLSKKEMLKLTNEKLDNKKIIEFKNYALNKYGNHISVPISFLILSN
jgi:hypothetical protein